MAMNPKNKQLVTVFAHPDDAEIWAGGTIAKWNSKGGTSTIICFSEDDIRTREAEAGASKLGSELLVIGRAPEINESVIETLTKAIENLKPTILITHNPHDSHPEHRRVFELVSNSITWPRIRVGYPKMLLCSDTYNELGLDGVFNPNVYIDISDFFSLKTAAIRLHKSQPTATWVRVAGDQNRLLGARLSGAKYAEGFVQVPILGALANLSLF